MKQLFYILLFCLFNTHLCEAQTFNAPKYTTDAPVYDLDNSGDTMLVAGAFDFVGKYSTGIAHVTANSDTILPAPYTENETAWWSTNDGAGGYYVLQTPSGTIKHILPNKQYDPNFSVAFYPGSLVSWSEVRMIYLSGKIYIAGHLTYWSAGAIPNNIVVLDVATKQITNSFPFIDGGVSSIRLNNNKLYAIGSFQTVGGLSRKKIASFDLSDNTLTPWYPAIDSCMQSTLAMTDIAFRNNQAYISGHYQNMCVSGINVSKVGVFDLTTGANAGYLFGDAGIFSGGFNTLYWAVGTDRISIDGNLLYIKSGGTYDTRLTCYDIAQDSVLWARFFYLTNTIREMKVIGSNIYCVGDLTEVYNTDYVNYTTNGLDRKLHNCVAFNKNTGVTVSWDPFGNGSFHCISNEAGNIFLTGNFSHMNCLDRKALYSIKTSTNTILPFNINSHPNGEVFGVKVKDGLVYIVGNWFSPSFQPYSFAVYNLSTGVEQTAFTKSFGSAYCVDVSSNYIFVGGAFTENSNGIAKSNLIAINKITGAVENWTPNPNDQVHRLLVADGKLYVGGYFTTIGGQTRERFAVYDANTLTLLSAPIHSFNGLVNSFKVDGGKIWIGGEFNTVDNNHVSQLLAISRADGTIVRTTNLSNYDMSGVKDILAENGKVITANVQTYYGVGDTCSSPLTFNVTNTEAIKTNDYCVRVDGDIYKNIYCNLHIGNELYFGGAFNKINSKYQSPSLGRISMPTNYFSPTPTAAEIDVEGNSIAINSNNASYSAANNTLMGAAPVGAFITKTYTIINSGISNLNVTSMTVSGANASNFTVVSPFTGTIAAGAFATFQVKFTASGSGYKNATITINNNDANENPYIIKLRAYSGTAQDLHFDGVNDWLNTNINCDNTVMPNTTWEAWIKPTDSLNPNVQMVFSTDNFGWDRYLGISNNKFIMGLGYGNFEPVTVDWNKWQHVAVVYEGTSVRFYKNGVEYIYNGAVDTFNQNTNIPLQIGCSWHYNNDMFFKGYMDEIRIWNVAKQFVEITTMKNCRITSATPGLIANYTLEQGIPDDDNTTISTADDVSGNNNHAILNGFALNGTTSNFRSNDSLSFSTNCLATANVKIFLEGFYTGGGVMIPVLYNNGLTNNNTICDFVTIELHNAASPYNTVYSTSSYLSKDGFITVPLPSSLLGTSKYVVVKHRNALQTWSKNPVLITNGGTYNFTDAATKAFGDNMKQVGPGVWAFYSGDLNQDENIDLLDLGLLESDINNFAYGYTVSDVNGDGNVDLLDSPTIESNISNFVFSAHP